MVSPIRFIDNIANTVFDAIPGAKKLFPTNSPNSFFRKSFNSEEYYFGPFADPKDYEGPVNRALDEMGLVGADHEKTKELFLDIVKAGDIGKIETQLALFLEVLNKDKPKAEQKKNNEVCAHLVSELRGVSQTQEDYREAYLAKHFRQKVANAKELEEKLAAGIMNTNATDMETIAVSDKQMVDAADEFKTHQAHVSIVVSREDDGSVNYTIKIKKDTKQNADGSTLDATPFVDHRLIVQEIVAHAEYCKHAYVSIETDDSDALREACIELYINEYYREAKAEIPENTHLVEEGQRLKPFLFTEISVKDNTKRGGGKTYSSMADIFEMSPDYHKQIIRAGQDRLALMRRDYTREVENANDQASKDLKSVHKQVEGNQVFDTTRKHFVNAMQNNDEYEQTRNNFRKALGLDKSPDPAPNNPPALQQ